MKKFSPTEADKNWQQGMLEAVKDGGTWGVPATLTFYKVDHKNKTLHAEYGPGAAKLETSRRIEIVCKAIGWKVVDTGMSSLTKVENN